MPSCVRLVPTGFCKAEYAAAAMAFLEVFGLTEDVKKLVGGNVHSHFNILAMRSELHQSFDELDFWFEEVIGEFMILSLW